jgi:hypothetical protein
VTSQERPRHEQESVPGSWLTVCLGCGRLKRGDVWTNEEIPLPAKGISTGFCDACFAKRMADRNRKTAEEP